MRAAKRTASIAAFAAALAGPALLGICYAQATGQQQPQGQQPQGQQPAQGGQKNWKDRAEYDLYNSIAHEQDLHKRLDLLDQWTQKYPTTDFTDLRAQTYVATLGPLSAQDPSVRPKAIEAAKKVLATNPKDFTSLYWLAIDTPAQGGSSPSPDQIHDAETAGNGLLQQSETVFEASKKPAATSDADWAKAKNDVVALAHAALGWAANAKKDLPTAQKEFEAYLKANPNNANISYQLGQVVLQQQKPDLYPLALWSFARAAAYEGQGSIPAGNRPQVLAYFKKVYTQYHGSEEGADNLLSQAKESPLPPDGFKIVSAAETANKQAADLQSKISSDPSLAMWYSIQQSLTGDQGESFFTNNVKDAEIPGGANGVKTFTGTVISVEPTKVVLGVLDPTKPDATLTFDDPLPPDAVKVGDKIQFSGIGESFTKEPFMLTFKDAALPGVKTVKAPTKRPARRTRPR